jgi:hypothetical protein
VYSKEPGAFKRYIAKTMFPEIHQKTHFRAATSFYLDLPGIRISNRKLRK